MTATRQPSRRNTRALTLTMPVLLLAVMFVMGSPMADAQTFTVLHSLNGGSDGQGLLTGLVSDRQGNLYGAAYTGGLSNCPFSPAGCGTVFKLTRHGSVWAFTVLYRFTGISDGWWPENLAVATDGTIFGVTIFGGESNACGIQSCGTIFRLQPPPNPCPTTNCLWRKTTIYQFSSGIDGRYPAGLAFDRAGNLYGTTNESSENGVGNVWALSPSNGHWTFSVLHAFDFGIGSSPLSGVAVDAAGNLWGSGDGGVRNCGDPGEPSYCGNIWELTRSASGWNFNIVFDLNRSTGGAPIGLFQFDPAGLMYGTLSGDGPNGNGGVFQFDPSRGQFNLLYAAPGNFEVNDGPQGGVTIDQHGDLFAADPMNGTAGLGYVFKLAPSNGSWIFTDLHDFTDSGDDGAPYGPLVVDSAGNVYGATYNTIFRIAP
jgi:hypothetical protein